MFCASESATAICKGSSSTATIHLGGGSACDIDRHIFHGSSRSLSSLKHERNSKFSSIDQTSTVAGGAERRKSSASASLVDVVRKSNCIKPSAYFSPHPSSKSHLKLSKSQSYHDQPQFPDKELALVPAYTGEMAKYPKGEYGKLVKCSSLNADTTAKPLFVPSSPFRINSDQVVVVRVSLHCKGCAGKVKKYISRMRGVTSFNVDFEAKKVIVVGVVTPLEVLTCISKVRTAQLLPPEKPNAMLNPTNKYHVISLTPRPITKMLDNCQVSTKKNV